MSWLAQVPNSAPDYWPFVVLLISVTAIVVLITVMRVHAFLALILAAFTAGLLARSLPGEPEKAHWVQALELTTAEFGLTAGKIGVVIALASMIGLCLMESGAADKVVRRFLALLGERRAGAAILVSGYILSIPIFFDTFFMLLLPLAVAMAMRTGKDYLLYVMAICCGGVITHSLVAPHPGPLAMAESLKLDLGLTIMVGIVVGVIPMAVTWQVVKWLNRRFAVTLRETPAMPLSHLQAIINQPESELPSFTLSILPVILPIVLISTASTFVAIQGKGFDAGAVSDPRALMLRFRAAEDPVTRPLNAGLSPKTREGLAAYDPSALPSLALQNAVLGELNRMAKTNRLFLTREYPGVALRPETARLKNLPPEGENLARFNRLFLEDALPAVFRPTQGMNPMLFKWGEFAGNRNLALLIGAVIAIGVLMKQRGLGLAKIGEMMGPPFETAGVIILITSAGGAFGLMLKNAGVGEAVKALVEGKDINLLLLAWLVAAVIRIAQGSATVAMLTTAAMVYPIMTSTDLPYHPVYVFIAIGFGAMILSWMNDSGFWVVGRLSGFTERETLKSWTVVVTVNSVVGLAVCLALSSVLPFKAG
jgi:H+/gluconate symporter-like permease